jgi:hypothetical protein
MIYVILDVSLVLPTTSEALLSLLTMCMPIALDDFISASSFLQLLNVMDVGFANGKLLEYYFSVLFF